MRIVIFHYHLNPGGVTRIIESQVEAIKSNNPNQDVLVITGDCIDSGVFDKLNIPLIINPRLNYLTEADHLHDKFSAITEFLNTHIEANDILHFHNLNLGKNPLLTLATSKLVAKGVRLINHAHDFSEDRVANQKFMQDIIETEFEEDLKEVMYPNLANYHYATLNSFDLKRLFRYGIEEERCHLLPNPVVFQESLPKGDIQTWRREIFVTLNADQNKLMVTYPVRVIRRKNIGEFILLAYLFADKANWVVTQPPKNPIELEPYNRWKKFCSEEKIEISWEAGTKVDFEKLIRVSDFCISTSIQEGFGMVFMEPWLLETSVIGRDIPMVTEDMIDAGVNFSGLYNSFNVKDNKQLHEFDIDEQITLIKEIIHNDTFQQQILSANPSIKNLLNQPSSTLVAQNKEVILSKFSLSSYGEKLNEAYRRIIG